MPYSIPSRSEATGPTEQALHLSAVWVKTTELDAALASGR